MAAAGTASAASYSSALSLSDQTKATVEQLSRFQLYVNICGRQKYSFESSLFVGIFPLEFARCKILGLSNNCAKQLCGCF